MRIPSNNGGYLEFQRSKKPNHVHVIVAARCSDNPLKLLINSAEIPLAKMIEGVKSVLGPLILDLEKENVSSDEGGKDKPSSKTE